VSLLAEKKAKTKSFRGPEPLKELGASPSGAPVKLMRGRYGPYVTDGTTNATIPRDADPLSVTLEQALALISEREAKGGGKPKKTKKKETAPKTAVRKTSTPAKKKSGAPAKKSAPAKTRKTAKAENG
ncbi:MAG TPA: topoisomerase C-terminal repeat-containing protein, partial [Rhizomicrobium sp.]